MTKKQIFFITVRAEISRSWLKAFLHTWLCRISRTRQQSTRSCPTITSTNSSCIDSTSMMKSWWLTTSPFLKRSHCGWMTAQCISSTIQTRYANTYMRSRNESCLQIGIEIHAKRAWLWAFTSSLMVHMRHNLLNVYMLVALRMCMHSSLVVVSVGICTFLSPCFSFCAYIRAYAFAKVSKHVSLSVQTLERNAQGKTTWDTTYDTTYNSWKIPSCKRPVPASVRSCCAGWYASICMYVHCAGCLYMRVNVCMSTCVVYVIYSMFYTLYTDRSCVQISSPCRSLTIIHSRRARHQNLYPLTHIFTCYMSFHIFTLYIWTHHT